VLAKKKQEFEGGRIEEDGQEVAGVMMMNQLTNSQLTDGRR